MENMMEQQHGIDNLKAIVLGVCQLANAAVKADEDGTIDYKDIGLLFGFAKSASTLSDVNLAEALAEGRELTPDEQAELVDYLSENLEIDVANIKDKIDVVLEQSKAVYSALYQLIGAIKKIKSGIVEG